MGAVVETEMLAQRSRTSLSVSNILGDGSSVDWMYTSPLLGLAATRGEVRPPD